MRMKACVLTPGKARDDCEACDERCELDPEKICDNCFRCLEGDRRPFAQIPIGGVLFDDSNAGESLFSLKPDLTGDDYLLDSDDAWREGFSLRISTLRHMCARRKKQESHR